MIPVAQLAAALTGVMAGSLESEQRNDRQLLRRLPDPVKIHLIAVQIDAVGVDGIKATGQHPQTQLVSGGEFQPQMAGG
ncbi:hypothetical protein WH50_02715 [Pokkaliibacter plantistimulans]|uniref:Uncharacterized protein n=1 Tax=Pokkaliibacter plantistimulans TaxID=1635171 RepID=A0ABX5M2R9_9GAMM|nr:hypothetical protein WH50_02715 [Pokkaliibacter plantistimulans]